MVIHRITLMVRMQFPMDTRTDIHIMVLRITDLRTTDLLQWAYTRTSVLEEAMRQPE